MKNTETLILDKVFNATKKGGGDMVTAVTRNDVQVMVEGVKNSLLDRLAPRNYIQAMAESVRMSILQNLEELHAENQQMLRNSQMQRVQLVQKVTSIETEVRALRQLVVQLIDQQIKLMSRLPKG
jgi:hypothetical protein